MKCALDATPLTLASGGLHRYTAELSRALAERFPEDEIALASDQPFEMPGPPLANLARLPGPRTALERRWWAYGLNRALSRAGADIFHGTNFEVPYAAQRPAVLTVHDLSPWLEPFAAEASARVRRRTPALIRAGSATLVVTPTQAVRKQAIEYFRLHPDKVVAVPEAAAPFLRPVETRPAQPYFLYVGALERRKNLSTMVEAWREVRREFPVELVLAGRCRPGFPEFPPEPGLRVPGEVAGGAAVLVEARDARGWAEALKTAAACPEWIAGLRSKSLARAREFSWARTAQAMREVYEDARRRFGR
jgi:glycosyltransferase involved in cell wall biosynthesis